MKFEEALTIIRNDKSMKMHLIGEEQIHFFINRGGYLDYFCPFTNSGMRPLYRGIDFEVLNSNEWVVEKLEED